MLTEYTHSISVKNNTESWGLLSLEWKMLMKSFYKVQTFGKFGSLAVIKSGQGSRAWNIVWCLLKMLRWAVLSDNRWAHWSWQKRKIFYKTRLKYTLTLTPKMLKWSEILRNVLTLTDCLCFCTSHDFELLKKGLQISMFCFCFSKKY